MTAADGRLSADVHRQPTCFGCGLDNPAGLRGKFVGRGEELLGTMVVTDTMVGAPGRLHGGVMMAFFDEALGLLCKHLGGETMTANLTVDFRAPVYVGATLELRAWVERHDGRKWCVRAEAYEDDRLIAEARGLWIEVHPAWGQPRRG
jgi:uncharacterized protein (TIGR00369 family)